MRVPRRGRSSGGHWALAAAASFLAFVAIGGVLLVLKPHHHALPPTGLRLQPTSPAPTTSTHAPATQHRRRPRRLHRPSSPVTVPVANTPPAPAPSASPTPAPSRTAPPRPRRFTALAGTGCPQSASSGTERTAGWYIQPAGGWTGEGCSGAYVSKWVHQSGTAPVRTFGWWFMARALRRATCRVSVYVPAGSATAVGANPARYTVYTGSPWTVAGTFRIDQRDYHRRWVFVGVFPAQAGRLSVEVQNIGGGSAEVAADALAVSCTSRL